MMRSMYSGVAGLKTHQTKMDVIGNNIANVNTTAYKSQSITFSDLMYQTTQQASGANALTGIGGVNARQIGLGVKAGAINTAISTQGATQTTNNPFDIMITGDAFFIVSDGSSTYFTRDGSFYVDGVGNLCMTSNGYTVMGWLPDPDNPDTIRQDTVQPLQIMSAENLTYPPEATSLAYVSGILDKNDTDVTSTAGKTINLQIYDSLGYLYTARLNFKSTEEEGVYSLEFEALLDSNNEPIDISGVSFGSTQTVSRSNSFTLLESKYEWSEDGELMDITSDKDEDGNYTSAYDSDDVTEAIAVLYGDGSGSMTEEEAQAVEDFFVEAYGLDSLEDMVNQQITYTNEDGGETTITLQEFLFDEDKRNAVYAVDEDGEYGSLATDEDGTATGYDLLTVNTNTYVFEGVLVEYDAATGSFVSVNNADTVTLELSSIPAADGSGSSFSDVEIDFTTTNMYNNSGSSTISATNGDFDGLGSGRKLGAMSGIVIDTSGRIYASYDNGQTKLLGQIAVAEFANASGLQKEGDNLYSATLNSGEFDGIGVDITANGGYMNSGVLEMSNVDLSAEFTEMITTQRGFQANSRIITVSDSMLEELVNLKR